MSHSEEYRRRVNSFQKSILIVQLLLMVLGGVIFALGVISRPILRITKVEFMPTVRWIVNVMVGAGLIQIATAAYDIFSGCWKLIWPLYLGIGVTSLTVLLELTAIGSSLYLYTQSGQMVNEEVVHPWYWVECLKWSSCHDTMLRYIHTFILPQVILAGVTVLLQCLGIILLARLVSAIADHFRVLHVAQQKYHEKWAENQWEGKKTPPQPGHSRGIEEATAEMMKTPKSVSFRDHKFAGEEVEMNTTSYKAEVHAVAECSTPASIIKTDHGYVAGSRVSLDIDKL